MRAAAGGAAGALEAVLPAGAPVTTSAGRAELVVLLDGSSIMNAINCIAAYGVRLEDMHPKRAYKSSGQKYVWKFGSKSKQRVETPEGATPEGFGDVFSYHPPARTG